MGTNQLSISLLVVASLFAATTIAAAQTQTAPGTSSEGNRIGRDKPNMKPGTTTGSATQPRTNKGVLPDRPAQAERDAGTGRGK